MRGGGGSFICVYIYTHNDIRLGIFDIATILENYLEKGIEHEMETAVQG